MDDLERQVAERLWYTVARIAHPLTSGSVTATLAPRIAAALRATADAAWGQGCVERWNLDDAIAAGLAALKGGDDA